MPIAEFDENEAIKADDKYRQGLGLGGTAVDFAATKQFAVNATGNLFVATTLNGGDADNAQISAEAKKAFQQVSVFFAAMTKAMVLDNGQAKVYDYDTINNIVSGSAMFVKVTDSCINFESKRIGIHFGTDLIETLFGLSGGLASIAKSLTDMIIGIGKEAKTISLSADSQKTEKKVGTIIFVCEYLLGAVSITPIVLSVDAKDAAAAFKAGPCLGGDKHEKKIKIVKQVYSFVPPEFIKEAGALNAAMEDEQLDKLVSQLRGYINLGSGQEPASQ